MESPNVVGKFFKCRGIVVYQRIGYISGIFGNQILFIHAFVKIILGRFGQKSKMRDELITSTGIG